MTDTGRRCPRCKAPLAPDADPGAPCPACLMRLGLPDSDDAGRGDPGIELDVVDPDAVDAAGSEPIGNWRPLRRLGEGGMGVVWLAEEIGPLRRRAALKRIKHGLDSKRVLERFEQERRVLARMDHPGIARVLDAGTARNGTPFFAMEYIDGLPITEYCDRARLDTRTRLMLFERLCDAVEHAHRRGILHRDLKPSNVLVVDGPDGPQPKVIDFGVARAVAQRRFEWSVFTEFGRLIGTPEYMSPEQADMENDDLDTRSDVYALGVVLYELLVGKTPRDAVSLRALGLQALLKTIREGTFPTPSSRLSTLGGEAEEIASRRGSDAAHLRRRIAGELDWIVMRATERERERRYGSARELAADVRRYLDRLPVEAGPPGAAYRLRKLVARHRVAVAVAGAVLLALLLGIAGTSWGMLQALAAREETRRKAAELESALAFQRSMLEEVDVERVGRDIRDALRNEIEASAGDAPPAVDRALDGMNMTNVAREIVDRNILGRAAESIDARFGDEPRVEAAVRDSIGGTYLELGMYERALPHLERALGLRRDGLGSDHPDTLTSTNALARLLVRMGRREEAIELYRAALEGRRRVLGNDHPDTLRSINNMGYGLEQSGRFEEALPYFREAMEGRRRVLGDDDVETLSSINNVGYALRRMDRLEEAEPYYREALERGRRVLGPDHPDVLVWVNNNAHLVDALGRFDEAVELHREALAGRRRVLGDEHPATLQSWSSLGQALVKSGRVEEAREAVGRALDGRRRVLGEGHPDTLMSFSDLGRVHHEERDWAEAERLGRDAVARARRHLPEGDWLIGRALFYLGRTLSGAGKTDEAERALVEAHAVLADSRGPRHSWTLAPVELLVRLYERTGRHAEAETWRARLASSNSADEAATPGP